MNRGKTIRIFLVDGAPTGTLTAEIMNWTGKVVVFSRSQLPDAAKRDEAHRTGIYFLAGADPANPTRECVYIGEADDVLKRLAIHDREDRRDFWERTIILVSKDENLTKAHARYLESRLLQLARAAHRAQVTNDTSPPTPALPEADIADMEHFLDQVVMMLPVLGFGFLQPKPTVSAASTTSGTSPLFRIETKAGIKAQAREAEGEFVVLKGSLARKGGFESTTNYRSLRDGLVEGARLVDAAIDGLYAFAEDVPFASPSAAAAVVLGRSANGRLEWKTADTGKTYADWQTAQLRLAGVDPSAGDE